MDFLPEKTLIKLEPIDRVIDYYIPSCQRLLNSKYIEELCGDQIKEYNNFGMLSALQSITCALYNCKMYILDGQHRIQMFKNLKEKGFNLSKSLIPVVIYNVKTIEELTDYFNRINKHNPINPLQLNEDWIQGKSFFKWFGEEFIKYFSDKDNCRCPNFNMNDMMNRFSQFEILKKISNINIFIEYVKKLNKHLVENRDSIQNNQLQSDISIKFEKCFNKCTTNPCMLGIWRQYEWVELVIYGMDNHISASNLNLAKFCKNRPTINANLKLNVWNKRNQISENPTCYCCNDDITFGNMECGHVLPHCKGGSIDLNNLEPVCKKCNRDMGIMNLEDYRKGRILNDDN
jgi:hypothetical protein